MRQWTYVWYEILRTIRNRRFLIFSLIFPLVLFFSIAGEHRHVLLEGIPFPLYFMTGMMAFGSMTAITASGARIAAERQAGWTRQIRITPLKTSTYFVAKVVTGYLMALFSILILALAGTSLGVRLEATQWLIMVGLILVGLMPIAVIGILLGHLVTVDSLGPALGGVTSLLALLGGAFGPLATSGTLLSVAKCLPSYWIVQAGKTALGGTGWPAEGWIVIAVWTVILVRLTALAYRRVTARV